MLSKIVLAVVFGIVAYLICVIVGTLLIATGVNVGVAVGSLFKELAGIVSILVFLYYAFVNGLGVKNG